MDENGRDTALAVLSPEKAIRDEIRRLDIAIRDLDERRDRMDRRRERLFGKLELLKEQGADDGVR